MITATNIAEVLFEMAGPEMDRAEFPYRQICKELVLRIDGHEIPAHSMTATPDTIELDCKDELELQQRIQVRLTDDPEAWSSAVVNYCTGTIIGYTVGLQIIND